MKSDNKKQPLAPHEKHYRAKMRRHGWMDEDGKLNSLAPPSGTMLRAI